MLGKAWHSIERTRVLPSSLDGATADVLRAFSSHPCLLRPRDIVELPSNGGRVVVFEVPKYDGTVTANPPFVEKAYMCGLTVLHVMLRPVPEDATSTEIVVSGDLYAGRRKSWRWGAAVSSGIGAVGGALGVGVGTALTLAGGVLALPALAGFVALGGITSSTWGWSYRYYAHQVEEIIEDALSHLQTSSRSLSRFSGRDPV